MRRLATILWHMVSKTNRTCTAVPRGRAWSGLPPPIANERRLMDALGMTFHSLSSEGFRRLCEKQTERLHRQDAMWHCVPAARVSLRWHLDRDGRARTRPRFPTSAMIETTLADGTVVREMVCARLSEHRTKALLVQLSNSRRDVLGCSRVRESPCRIAGLVFRTKRTTAIEPANNGPRYEPKLPTDQTQTTQETFTSKSSALARAGGLCPPGPPRFIASVPIPESNNRNGTPLRCEQWAPVSGLGSWRGESGCVSAWPCPPAG